MTNLPHENQLDDSVRSDSSGGTAIGGNSSTKWYRLVICLVIISTLLAVAMTVSQNVQSSVITSPAQLTDEQEDALEKITSAFDKGQSSGANSSEQMAAADPVDIPTQLCTSVKNLIGYGNLLDDADSAQCCRTAATHGDDRAQYELAGCYLTGQGVE